MSTADCPHRTGSEVTVSTTLPVTTPPVRLAALRGRVPLPWGAVAALAVVLAFANGFVVIALQGAVGAIERAQSPFTDWLRYSAMMVPVFGLTVVLALGRAHRRGCRTVRTLLLVAAAATAVGIAVMIVSSAYDYHLQSQLLARTATLHNHTIGGSAAANPAYADGAWTPEQRDTMLVEVKAIGLGSVLLAGVNLILVAWITALRGGRLAVVRRASVPTSG
jgi:hypothetical protein